MRNKKLGKRERKMPSRQHSNLRPIKTAHLAPMSLSDKESSFTQPKEATFHGPVESKIMSANSANIRCCSCTCPMLQQILAAAVIRQEGAWPRRRTIAFSNRSTNFLLACLRSHSKYPCTTQVVSECYRYRVKRSSTE